MKSVLAWFCSLPAAWPGQITSLRFGLLTCQAGIIIKIRWKREFQCKRWGYKVWFLRNAENALEFQNFGTSATLSPSQTSFLLHWKTSHAFHCFGASADTYTSSTWNSPASTSWVNHSLLCFHNLPIAYCTVIIIYLCHWLSQLDSLLLGAVRILYWSLYP